jgi:hypothetical protein
MGNGPDFERLPGPYLVAADSRSMDAETLAAVRWAGDELPAGSRIAAERVSSVLLASRAGLWPVMKDDDRGLYAPRLYFADEWGHEESEIARGLQLQYVYVDRRLARELPHAGAYFYKGDAKEAQQLTLAELTKFDHVRGIHEVYRHGPISIYDLSGLNIPVWVTGWSEKTPASNVGIEVAIGLLLGLALALVARSNAGRVVTEKIKSFQTTAGLSLTFAAGVATLCAASIMLLLAHIWLSPIVFLSMALVVLLVDRRWAKLLSWATVLLTNAAARPRWNKRIAAFAVLVVLAITQSILSAYPEDVTKVRSILNDPSVVHMSVHNPNPAGSPSGTP